MKVFVFLIFVTAALYSCTEDVKSESNSQSPEAKILYEKNLATLMKAIAGIEKENIDSWAEAVSDTTIWNSATYGSLPGTKEDWRKSLTEYFADWDSIKLNYPLFLPGIDSATHKFDGSVRYYGLWNGKHKSGVRTTVNMYATYDFDKENKIVNASEFYDVGGLTNAIKAKEKKPAD